MADEATIVRQLADIAVLYYTSTAINVPRGTLMALTGDNTIDTHLDRTQKFAGIAATQKIAADGAIPQGVFTRGVFDMTCEGAIVRGNYVGLSATANKIEDLGNAISLTDLDKIIGVALATGTTDAIINVQIGR